MAIKQSRTFLFTQASLANRNRAVGRILARVITLGALNRNESRGAHYKPDFPEHHRRILRRSAVLSYEPIDGSLVEPRKRDYSKAKAKG